MRLMFLNTKAFVSRVCWRSRLFVIFLYVLNTSLESRERPEYHRLLNSQNNATFFANLKKHTKKDSPAIFCENWRSEKKLLWDQESSSTLNSVIHSNPEGEGFLTIQTGWGPEGKKNSLLSHCLPPVSQSHCRSSSSLTVQLSPGLTVGHPPVSLSLCLPPVPLFNSLSVCLLPVSLFLNFPPMSPSCATVFLMHQIPRPVSI